MILLPLEVHLEELSAEFALTALMPAIVPDVEYVVRRYQGKHELLKKLPQRLLGYARYPGPDPDAIAGGTWEALERLLQQYGNHRAGLAKATSALEIADQMDVENNTSRSFQVFRDGLRTFTKGDADA